MNDISFDIVTGTSLTEAGHNFYSGIVNGLLVTVEYLQPRGQIEMRFGATRMSENDITAVCQGLRDIIDSKRAFLQIDDHSICVILHTDKNWQDRYHHVLEILDSLTVDISIRSGCFLCGKRENDIRPYEIESLKAFLCQKCAKNAKDALIEVLVQKGHNAKFTQFASSDVIERENFSLGMLGLLIGSFVGFILLFFLILIPLGYFYAGAVLSFCIIFAYTKGAGVLNIRGLLICMTCIALFLYFGVTVTSLPTIASEIKTLNPLSEISSGQLFWTFPKYLFDPVYGDSVVWNYILSIIGAMISLGYHIVRYMRNVA